MKDKLIGALLVLLGVFLIYFYVVLGIYAVYFHYGADAHVPLFPFIPGSWGVRVVTFLVVPVVLLIIVIGVIALWIGITMIRTPPPVPLEGFETIEEAPAEEKTEEKIEETTEEKPKKKRTRKKKTE